MSSVVSSLNCFICVQFSISESMTVLCFLHILCMSIDERKGVNEHTCGLKELMNYGEAQIKGVLKKKGGNANICRVTELFYLLNTYSFCSPTLYSKVLASLTEI
ncbi:hypothetical protein S83_010699 [Arachis hypogaea]